MSHQKDVYYALHDAPVVYNDHTQKVISKTDYINLSTIFSVDPMFTQVIFPLDPTCNFK